jgi:hypothetical protein
LKNKNWKPSFFIIIIIIIIIIITAIIIIIIFREGHTQLRTNWAYVLPYSWQRFAQFVYLSSWSAATFHVSKHLNPVLLQSVTRCAVRYWLKPTHSAESPSTNTGLNYPINLSESCAQAWIYATRRRTNRHKQKDTRLTSCSHKALFMWNALVKKTSNKNKSAFRIANYTNRGKGIDVGLLVWQFSLC